MTGDWVTLARVVKPQGRRGEVAAELHTDFPELFAERRRLSALFPSGQRREVEIEEWWPHKGRAILKLAGVDSISDAETLLGCELQVPREQRAALPEGEFYVSDLVGCTVLDHGRELGVVAQVQFGAGEAPLLIIGEPERYIVPFAGEYVQRVDVEDKRIELQLPEGMLEINAPVKKKE